MMVAKKQTDVAVHVFGVGDAVSVDLVGRVVGRSEFEEGPPTYLVEYVRRGKTQREWVVADKLVPA